MAAWKHPPRSYRRPPATAISAISWITAIAGAIALGALIGIWASKAMSQAAHDAHGMVSYVPGAER